MKKIVASVFALALLGSGPAYSGVVAVHVGGAGVVVHSHHHHHHHHRYRRCWWHHHHRVCRWY